MNQFIRGSRHTQSMLYAVCCTMLYYIILYYTTYTGPPTFFVFSRRVQPKAVNRFSRTMAQKTPSGTRKCPPRKCFNVHVLGVNTNTKNTNILPPVGKSQLKWKDRRITWKRVKKGKYANGTRIADCSHQRPSLETVYSALWQIYQHDVISGLRKTHKIRCVGVAMQCELYFANAILDDCSSVDA